MRKIIMSLILLLLAYLIYDAVMVGTGLLVLKPAPYEELMKQKKDMDSYVETLNRKNTSDYATAEVELNDAVQTYEEKRNEYESLASEQKELAYESTDLYDIEFLWTELGNYSRDNSVVIQFNVVKTSGVVEQSDEYKICDLEFTVIGDYTAITDFIYVLEDDDRFAFEISKFKLSEPESGGLTAALPSDIPSDLRDNQLQATFVVKSLPINASTISATYDETKASSEESTSDITDDIYDELY